MSSSLEIKSIKFDINTLPEAFLEELTDPVDYELLLNPTELFCNIAGYGNHTFSLHTVVKLLEADNPSCPLCRAKIQRLSIEVFKTDRRCYIKERLISELIAGDSSEKMISNRDIINLIIKKRQLALQSKDIWIYPIAAGTLKKCNSLNLGEFSDKEFVRGFENENKNALNHFKFGKYLSPDIYSCHLHFNDKTQRLNFEDELRKHDIIPKETPSWMISFSKGITFIEFEFDTKNIYKLILILNFIKNNNHFTDTISEEFFNECIRALERILPLPD